MDAKLGIVILAAGLGTRMKSKKAKVLHEVCGRTMIEHVVQTATAVAGTNVVVVVGYQAKEVKQVVSNSFEVSYAMQPEQLGTGHAVLCAMPQIPEAVEDVVILCGDVPLIRAATLERLVQEHQDGQRDATLLAVTMEDPTGYGRVLSGDDGQLLAIVEQADADEEQQKINVINSGIYAVKRRFLDVTLPQIGSDNAQNEIYLTDIIAIGRGQKKNIGILIGDNNSEIIGVNSLQDLQVAENTMTKMGH